MKWKYYLLLLGVILLTNFTNFIRNTVDGGLIVSSLINSVKYAYVTGLAIYFSYQARMR